MPAVNREQVVFVLTKEGQPAFLVHELVSDNFIADMVTDDYGVQASGEPHEWVAHRRADVEAVIRAQREATNRVKAEQVLGQTA